MVEFNFQDDSRRPANRASSVVSSKFRIESGPRKNRFFAKRNQFFSPVNESFCPSLLCIFELTIKINYGNYNKNETNFGLRFQVSGFKSHPSALCRFPKSRLRSSISRFNIHNYVCTFDQPTYDAPGLPRSRSRFVSVGCAAPGGGGSRRASSTVFSTVENFV